MARNKGEKYSITWQTLAHQSLTGHRLSLSEALSILQAPPQQLLAILQAAYEIRRHHFSQRVKLNCIANVKCGYCPENCGYCSQSSVSEAEIQPYSMLDQNTIVAGAEEALTRGARTYCIVASGRGPTPRELDHVIAAVREIKARHSIIICACLGILSPEQAYRLRQSGVDRYNHNLNTAASHHDEIVSSHEFADRIATLRNVREAGMSPCAGLIVGMGETMEQLVEVAYALRDLNIESIPVNFLVPIPGTPMGNRPLVEARFALQVLCLLRFLLPDKEIRVAGGREITLGPLQALSLYPANSWFVGDYLTTPGQSVTKDHQIIASLGFEIDESTTI
ncbi:biotin synthase BioB [Pasteuria penetrans]|uniref:biotin synthase BioB n=1 Tax=Pasteuria penetrans TaxID=86005 RepID=UPI001FE37BC5|nr:biotin synthase BioB [Pasteuria penetrans]